MKKPRFAFDPDRPRRPAGPPAPPTLADKIAAEPEWNPSTARLRDEILRRFTDRLDAIAAKHPDRLRDAIAVVVQAGPGRAIFVLSDPAASDTVKELERRAEDNDPSPLASLLAARLRI